MNPSPAIVAAFAPSGRLRASINLGNPLLARRAGGAASSAAAAGGAAESAGDRADTAGGAAARFGVSGVSVDLASALARQLGVELELVVVEVAAKSVEALEQGAADLGFFAIDPVRGAQIAFSPPYVLIEGFYLVREDSPIRSNGDADRPGQRVVVGKGSAYDLFLTRSLKQAEIVRASSSQAVVRSFLDSGAELAAGVRQQLEHDAAGVSGLRLLGERFMVIEQAMGLPKSRGPEAAAWLSQFVEQAKASGLVSAALAAHGVEGAALAPPA